MAVKLPPVDPLAPRPVQPLPRHVGIAAAVLGAGVFVIGALVWSSAPSVTFENRREYTQTRHREVPPAAWWLLGIGTAIGSIGALIAFIPVGSNASASEAPADAPRSGGPSPQKIRLDYDLHQRKVLETAQESTPPSARQPTPAVPQP